jgi:hypothetical protein
MMSSKYFVAFLFQVVIGANLFYVYEWPTQNLDLWPVTNHSTGDYIPYYRENNGSGPILNQTIGLHHTFQFGIV